MESVILSINKLLIGRKVNKYQIVFSNDIFRNNNKMLLLKVFSYVKVLVLICFLLNPFNLGIYIFVELNAILFYVFIKPA